MINNISNLLFENSQFNRDIYLDHINTRKGDGSFLNRLVCRWDEKKIGTTQEIHKHIYAAGIDKNDGVYLDCRKRLIFSKIVLSTTARPLHGLVKTLYHLSMFPVAKTIFLALRGKISAKEALIKSVQSIGDIFRTPAYEVAMIVVGLAGITTAFVAPKTLYKFREVIGKIEAALFRDAPDSFTLTPCFQSMDLKNMVEIFALEKFRGQFYLKNFEDTNYGEHSIENLLRAGVITKKGDKCFVTYRVNLNGLNKIQKLTLRNALVARSTIHFARAMIKAQRNHYNPFYQIFGKLNPKKAYISPANASISTEPFGKLQSKKKLKKQVRFAADAEHNSLNIETNQSNLTKKPVNFNEVYVRHNPKRKKQKLTVKKSFINNMQKDLMKDLKSEGKSNKRRLGIMMKCIANGFEDHYAPSLTETNETKGTALRNFESELDKILVGVTNSTLKGKNLKRDGEALLPVEVKYRERLKEIALKHASDMFSKPFNPPTEEDDKISEQTQPTSAKKKREHHHSHHETGLTSVKTEANLFETIEKQRRHRKHSDKTEAADKTTKKKHHTHRMEATKTETAKKETTKTKHHKHKHSHRKQHKATA